MGKKTKTTKTSSAAVAHWSPSLAEDYLPVYRAVEFGIEMTFFLFQDQSKSPPKAAATTPLLLGGSQHENNEGVLAQYQREFSVAPVFKGLERPDCLPQSSVGNSVFDSLSKADQAVAIRFLLGPLHIAYRVACELKAGVSSKEGPVTGVQDFEADLEGVTLVFSMNSVSSKEDVNEASAAFFRRLDDAQKEHLFTRVLHRLLRAYGAFLDPIDFFDLSECLDQTYRANGLWPELVDLRMIRADVNILYKLPSGSIWYLAIPIGHLAEAMQTIGEDQSAAWILLEAAGMSLLDGGESSDCPTVYARGGRELSARIPNPMVLTQNAAVAFHCAGKYQLAEATCIKAMSYDVNKKLRSEWDVNADKVSSVLGSLAACMMGDATSVTNEASKLYVGLLVWAGYQFHQFRPDLVGVPLEMARDLINDEFRNIPKATAVIFEAFKEGTVDSFISQMIMCRKPGMFMSAAGSFEVSSRKDARKAGRKNLFIPCSSCEKKLPPGQAKSCPCRDAFYCSKECQADHWRAHKKTCWWKFQQKLNSKK